MAFNGGVRPEKTRPRNLVGLWIAEAASETHGQRWLDLDTQRIQGRASIEILVSVFGPKSPVIGYAPLVNRMKRWAIESPIGRTSGVSVWLYAVGVLAGDFQRLGGARWRRREVWVRRVRCSRIRSMVFGSVMNETMRISSAHRGHFGGSTSKMRLSNSAQRRLASRYVTALCAASYSIRLSAMGFLAQYLASRTVNSLSSAGAHTSSCVWNPECGQLSILSKG